MNRNLAASALLALALGGCATQPEEQLPPQAGADRVELTKMQGGKFLALVGPKIQHTEPFLGVDGTNYFALRSWLDTRNGEIAHQVYVEDSYYGAPYRWNGAHDADGTALRFITISRNEIDCDEGCAYADEFAAALPDDLLRARRDMGLSVTFTAETGKTLTVEVPARQIAEELTALDATRTALAANAPPAQQTAPAAPAVPAPPPATAVPAETTPPAQSGR
jgi:hypothetical protein